MRNQATNPIIAFGCVQKEAEIPTHDIIQGYKRFLKMDVTQFFSGHQSIDIYRCKETGYRFYHPFDLEGDSAFYEQLEQFPWYYMADKWEHKIALEYIGPSNTVLEIGCAKGAFLKKVKIKGADGTGLELNQHAYKVTKDDGLEVYPETIQNHAQKHESRYDIVCSFQVLEHISAAGEAIQSMVAVLKPGGKLIVSVPNNQSFIKDDPHCFLNMPPHHMGLWDAFSLTAITKVFHLKLERICFEPLQRYHFRYYYQVKVGYAIERKLKFLGKVINKVVSTILYPFMFLMSNKIKGQTILAVYTKF